MLEDIIKSYLYQQYNDDANLQAFVDAYNKLAKEIYDWMVNSNLPVFIGGYNSGDQLKWIAAGIYGVKPPVLVSSKQRVFGPYNTIAFNQLAFNARHVEDDSEQVVVSDDMLQR